jgi:hypothetical protein
MMRPMTNAREQTARLADLLRREHHALADFLVALADFDAKRRWLELGYSGLFAFLNRELGLSKAASYFRKTAAELVRRYPEVIDPLRDGRLCLTAVVELAKVITDENRAEVLPRFFHCSKREAKAVSAALAPQEAPPRRDVVTAVAPRAVLPAVHRSVPSSPAGVETESHSVRPGEPSSDARLAPAAPPSAPPFAPPRRDQAEPLTSEVSRLHVTVSKRFLEKLEAAKGALSHSHPAASAEDVLEAGLDLVLARHAKRRGLVEKPRKSAGPADPGTIPAAVKRAVWRRAGGRCEWPVEGGGTCGSTLRLEFDHVQPRARGGPSTFENVRLACRLHNQHAARLAFGDAWMDRFTKKKGPREYPSLPAAP